jgi:hypothetical protein
MTQAQAETALHEPIVIYAVRGFDNYTFSLDEWSRGAVREALGADVPEPSWRLTLALDVTRPVEESFAAVHRHVIGLLTSMTPEQVAALGAVELRDFDSDRVLWRLPGRA